MSGVLYNKSVEIYASDVLPDQNFWWVWRPYFLKTPPFESQILSRRASFGKVNIYVSIQ